MYEFFSLKKEDLIHSKPSRDAPDTVFAGYPAGYRTLLDNHIFVKYQINFLK
jgi:hypothetical protein